MGPKRGEEEQERHDHDAAADTEERAEDAGDQADRNQPAEERHGHRRIVERAQEGRPCRAETPGATG